RGLSISKTYKDGLTRRLSKLEPMFPKITEVKIVLSKEKHRRTAALTLVAKHHTFRSEETAGDLETAVDMAVHALGRQVRDMKDRLKNRKAAAAPRRAPAPAGRRGGRAGAGGGGRGGGRRVGAHRARGATQADVGGRRRRAVSRERGRVPGLCQRGDRGGRGALPPGRRSARPDRAGGMTAGWPPEANGRGARAVDART